ncbi:MAG: 2Fe-2S iron-sulfur cluster binding domain-containing protein [Omnitrophica bacterium]|nr:2Fe-2S iron-sulfur cluster binding domain-containing protein [Candidatus Omnitrophota bacterium]
MELNYMIFITPVLVMVSIAAALAGLLAFADKYIASYGECKIVINKGKELIVEGGNALLSYLVDNKIFIPSACGGKGTCGYCKLKVLEGGGPLLPTETPYLTKQEVLHSVRLACQVKIKRDVELAIPEDLLAAEQFKSVIEKIEDLTHDIKRFVFKLSGSSKINFKAGQYVQFCIPDTTEFRAYSIASDPGTKDRVELMVRLVPGGLCSTYMHEALEVGDEACLTGPYGEFFLQENSKKDIICVGGGCGMAPIKSIINHLFATNAAQNITYFFGARQKKDLFYTEELERFEKKHKNFEFVPALSEPAKEDEWTGEVGFITQVMQKHLKYNKNQEAYLCGPPPMIDAAIGILTSKGININDIYYDKF